MSGIQKKLNKMEIFFDQEEYVVIDIGTGYLKAGFSGEDLPRVIIPTAVAEQVVELEEATVNPNGQTTEAKTKVNRLFGTPAFGGRGTHTLYKPVERGVITDDEHIKCLLTHIFETELGQDTK